MPDRQATRDQSKDIKLQLGEQLSFIVVTYGKNDPKQYHKKTPKTTTTTANQKPFPSTGEETGSLEHTTQPSSSSIGW